MNLLRLALCSAAALLVASATTTAAAQAQAGWLPADIDAESLARVPYLQRQALDEGTQERFAPFIGEGPNGALRGPLAFAAYTPGVAKSLYDLHNSAIAGTLGLRIRELAILVACRETNYDVGWNAHELAAVKAGVDPLLIDLLRNRGSLAGVPDGDAAVIRFGRQLLTEKNVDSDTFSEIVRLFGDRGAMDLVAVMSTYAVSGFYAIAVDQHVSAGSPRLPR